MLTRLARIAAAICLAGSTLFVTAAPLSAGWRWNAPVHQTAPSIPRAVDRSVAAAPASTYTTCNGESANHYDTGGGWTWLGSLGQRGVRTNIDPDDGFHDCTNKSPLQYTGSSAWVGIGGGPGTNSDSIIQIGVYYCHGPLRVYCPNEGELRQFWAYGGCNQYQAITRDMGPVDYASHRYDILYTNVNGADSYHFYVDGVFLHYIVRTSPAINCWIDNASKTSLWFGERWNRNDGLGSALKFTGMQRYYSNAWQLTASNCTVSGQHDHCTDSPAGTGSQTMWTSF